MSSIVVKNSGNIILGESVLCVANQQARLSYQSTFLVKTLKTDSLLVYLEVVWAVKFCEWIQIELLITFICCKYCTYSSVANNDTFDRSHGHPETKQEMQLCLRTRMFTIMLISSLAIGSLQHRRSDTPTGRSMNCKNSPLQSQFLNPIQIIFERVVYDTQDG